jgi:DNA-binding PadR family transcriptional regulator
MSSDLPRELAERIGRLEEIKEDLEREIEVTREMRERLATGQRPKSHFLRVAEALLSRNNAPKSARWLLKETGISRSSLSQILHRTNKDAFVSSVIPGFSRKKRWSLTEKGAAEARRILQGVQTDLFGVKDGELTGMKAVDCCARILKDHGNEPMNALTMAREAIQRGYKGYRVKGSEDEILLTTAKSFWAALGRDERFEEVRPLVFALREDETNEKK